MPDGVEVCGISMGAGAVGGGILGGLGSIAVGIWVCVNFIQPAFASIDGVSGSAASAITAAIALCGGLAAVCGLGMASGAAIGAIATPVVAGIAYCAGSIASKCTFFNRTADNNQNAPAPKAEVEAEAVLGL